MWLSDARPQLASCGAGPAGRAGSKGSKVVLASKRYVSGCCVHHPQFQRVVIGLSAAWPNARRKGSLESFSSSPPTKGTLLCTAHKGMAASTKSSCSIRGWPRLRSTRNVPRTQLPRTY